MFAVSAEALWRVHVKHDFVWQASRDNPLLGHRGQRGGAEQRRDVLSADVGAEGLEFSMGGSYSSDGSFLSALDVLQHFDVNATGLLRCWQVRK